MYNKCGRFRQISIFVHLLLHKNDYKHFQSFRRFHHHIHGVLRRQCNFKELREILQIS